MTEAALGALALVVAALWWQVARLRAERAAKAPERPKRERVRRARKR